jgi:hypothetical protein
MRRARGARRLAHLHTSKGSSTLRDKVSYLPLLSLDITLHCGYAFGAREARGGSGGIVDLRREGNFGSAVKELICCSP